MVVRAPTEKAARKWADFEGSTFVSSYCDPCFDRADDFLDTDGTETDSVEEMSPHARGKPELEVDEKGEET